MGLSQVSLTGGGDEQPGSERGVAKPGFCADGAGGLGLSG